MSLNLALNTSVMVSLLGTLVTIWESKIRESLSDSALSLSFSVNVLHIFLLISFIFVALLFYLRKRSKRSLELKHRVHQLVHKLRDLNSELSRNGAGTQRVTEISKDLIDSIERYFSLLVPNKDIKCSIRLSMFDNDTGSIKYTTVARSSNFNINRQKTTVPVPCDSGEAALMEENHHNGVVVFHDIKECLKSQYIYEGDNFKKYRGEINNMIVAPINGWDGKTDGSSMLGMLYICSKDEKAFSQKHTDAALFVADVLANVYSLYYVEGASHEKACCVFEELGDGVTK